MKLLSDIKYIVGGGGVLQFSFQRLVYCLGQGFYEVTFREFPPKEETSGGNT